MRKVFAFILVGLTPLVCGQTGEENPLKEREDADGLPEWNDEELEALESGEYIPGSSLMGSLAREILDSEIQEVIELDPAIRGLLDERPKSEEWSKMIDEEFLSTYFQGTANGYLIDPQELLATQELRDRESFLNGHARNAIIGCHFYLFDRLQELPEGESLEALVDSHFDAGKPLAVVFYFMGNPKRSQLVFSNRVATSTRLEDREGVLRVAIEDALEKSDPTSQLDSFSIQLSMGLLRLEEMVRERGGSLLGGEAFIMEEENNPLLNQPNLWEKLISNRWVFNTLLGLAILLPSSLIGMRLRSITNKRKVYVYPIAEGSALLNAPHAAGVGGVLSFVSATASPSSQKQDVPDYLQKI